MRARRCEVSRAARRGVRLGAGMEASRPAQRSKLQTHSASESARLQSRVLACSHVRKKIPTTLPRGDRSPRRRRARTHRQHRDGRHEPRWARGRAGGRRRLRAARGFGRCGDARASPSPVFPVFPRLPRGKPPPRRGRDVRPLRGRRAFAPITASADSRARPAAPREDAPHLRGLCPSASFSGRLAEAPRRDRPRDREKASPPRRRRRRRRRINTRCLSCSREGGCTASHRRENPENPVARTPICSISPTTSSAWRSTPRPPKRRGA